MMITILYAVEATPFYRNELRHLPEKLKQERIQQTVKNTFLRIKNQIVQIASENKTETNFTLYCTEPNNAYKAHGGIFKNNGPTYKLASLKEAEIYNHLIPIYPRPMCNSKDGYEIYRNHYSYGLHMRLGQQPDGSLEDEPSIYIQNFFHQLNQAFPDITLTLSQERKSKDGIFETECCPIYIVSW